jgi:hypothetical protein
MALWKPNNTIGKQEYIGRRLFRREGLKGARDQTRPEKTFELYHFEENRDREVSVDRLGATSVDKKVKIYLNPRGHHAATKLHKSSFEGWAVTRAKELQSPPESFQITPSPIAPQQGELLADNGFHAHIEMPGRYTSHDMAVMLKYVFEKNYHLEPSIPLQSASLSAPSSGWLRRLWRRIWVSRQ